jgi:hypothetical protein
MKGVVPLTDPAQVDGILDPEAPLKRPALMLRIERACRSLFLNDSGTAACDPSASFGNNPYRARPACPSGFRKRGFLRCRKPCMRGSPAGAARLRRPATPYCRRRTTAPMISAEPSSSIVPSSGIGASMLSTTHRLGVGITRKLTAVAKDSRGGGLLQPSEA